MSRRLQRGAKALDRLPQSRFETDLGLEAHPLTRSCHIEIPGRLAIGARGFPNRLALKPSEPRDCLGQFADAGLAPCADVDRGWSMRSVLKLDERRMMPCTSYPLSRSSSAR
jgi:hypothetical protein